MTTSDDGSRRKRLGPPWSLPCFIYGSFHIGIPVSLLLYVPPDQRNTTACWIVLALGIVIAALGVWAVKRETSSGYWS